MYIVTIKIEMFGENIDSSFRHTETRDRSFAIIEGYFCWLFNAML